MEVGTLRVVPCTRSKNDGGIEWRKGTGLRVGGGWAVGLDCVLWKGLCTDWQRRGRSFEMDDGIGRRRA